MSVTVNNIGLYLSSRVGNRTDYKLVLSVYVADHANGGVPDGNLPLITIERTVDDIDYSGWFVFNFPYPVVLIPDYYCITLYQKPDNVDFPVDFSVNFVQWFYTSCEDHSNKGVSSFSSDLQFTSDVYGYGYGGGGYGSTYATSPIYGYGYGYGDPADALDFFNIFEAGENDYGYAIGQPSFFYSYGYGFEYVDFVTDDVIQRNFKVYEDFNHIEFEGENNACINIPAAEEITLILNNRQEFLMAEQDGTAIVNDFITLDGFGERLISTNVSPLTSDCISNKNVDWFPANFALSSNDLNYVDTVNSLGNTNPFNVNMASSPYYGGIYISVDGGSSWDAKNDGLTLVDNSIRNISCVKFGPDGSFILAFDNTSLSERGKVFKSINLGESWTELILASATLSGIIVNDGFVISSSEIWIGTDNGVYRSLDAGTTWFPENNGLPSLTNVNQILVDLDILGNYGYGYGGGEGISYFDVFGSDGSLFGYGFGSFEMSFSENFGYEYGYEYGFSGGSSRIVAIATEFGAYWLVNGVWERIYPDIGQPEENTNTILFSNNNIFIGKDDGLIRSEIVGPDEEFDRIRFRGHKTSEAINGDFYVIGLSRRKTTKVRLNRNKESEIFVAQHGGVFFSENDGGNFVNLTKSISERSLKIKDIITNPIDSEIIYASVETTKFANAGVTILVDCSGSMVANDPEEKRIDMALNIVDNIVSVAVNTPYFQIIRFGVSENILLRNQSIYNSLRTQGEDFDIIGAFNLTKNIKGRIVDAGYSSNVTLVRKALDVSCREPSSAREHARTLFFDALTATSTGLANFGSRWEYKENVSKYIFDDISSNFYNNLDKSLIIITDGNDTVDGKTLQQLIDSSSNYNNIPSKTYIVGVGHNINFENLKALRESNKNSKLYLAPFDENIYSTLSDDVSDVILDREKFRNRSGIWRKLIDLEEPKITKNVILKANVPSSTTLTYRLRTTNNKKDFTDFTVDFLPNTINTVNLSGRYISIAINFESESTSFAPEVSEIRFTILEPSRSYVNFPIKNTSNSDRISEIELSSLDDLSLGNVSSDVVKMNFGLIQSESTNFKFSNKVHRDLRSVMLKRDFEDLTSEDGFFFKAKNGPWPGDTVVRVVDFLEFNANPNEGVIDGSLYFAIPSEGLIIFFDKVNSDKKIKLDLDFISQYRIGTEIINLSDAIDCFNLHDIAWVYYTDSNSVLPRSALPKVPSQLAGLETFGILSDGNHETGFGLATTYLVQYILNDVFNNGIISITNGQRINLKTTGNSDILRFYNQNAFLPPTQIENALDDGFLRVLNTQGIDFGIVTIQQTTTSPLHYQINVKTSSQITVGESVVFSIGDRSQGSRGISTETFQENLLFKSNEETVCEFQTNFYIGQKSGTQTPSVQNGDFDKIITPNLNLIGQNATSIIVLCPTTVSPGSFFNVKFIAVDDLGIVDKEFTGTIQFDIENPTMGTFVDGFSKQFSLSNSGVLDMAVLASSSLSGSTRIRCGIIVNQEQSSSTSFDPTLFDNIFFSNTFLIDSSFSVKWGDLNISTIFGDGRQDIDFVANYAEKTSALNFIGITDDIDILDDQEWAYTLFRTDALTNNNLVIYPGFRHRASDFYGERMVVFGGTDATTTPQTLASSLKPINFSNPQEQLTNLVNGLTNKDYITIPIHTPYQTDQTDFFFRGRGFLLDRYRNIVDISASMESFITNIESSFEIYSEHGNAETPDFYQSENFIGSESNLFETTAYVQRALFIGKRLGFVAGSGGYHSRSGYYKGDSSPRTQLIVGSVASNRGLTAVLTENVDRTEIFNKIKQRKTYATTGARMFLHFEATTQSQTKGMGEVFSNLDFDTFGDPIDTITFKIRATSDNSTITRIQIIKIKIDENITTVLDSRISGVPPFNVVDFGNDTGLLAFVEDISDNAENQEYCYYVRISQDDGHFAWSSPIWFNFGREEGIRITSDVNFRTVSQPSLSSDQGDIPEIPYSLSKNPPDGVSLPIEHTNDFFGNDSNERKTYLDKSLFVSEKNINLSGIRLIETGNINVIYGTHFLKFIGSRDGNDFTIEAKSPLTGINGTGQNDTAYKFLNDGIDDKLPNRPNFVKRHRSYWFGYMWQYVSEGEDFRTPETFSFEGNENNNTIHKTSSLEKTKVIMKPSMLFEGNRFYLFYSSSISPYPERPEAGFGGEAGTELYRDESNNTNPTRILSEEVVGFNILPNLNDWGQNMGIHFASAFSSESREDFLFNSSNILPNSIDGNPILFSHSPCIFKVDGDAEPFKVYYLGWFGNPLRLSIFRYSFSDINNPTAGTTIICYQFGTGDSSYDKHNFVPYNSNDGFDDLAWPDDPFYAISTNWLSVIKFDDGNYYAFFNFENVGPKNENNVQQPGTGILFSFDGQTFFEKNPSNTSQFINPLGVQYVHVFKKTINTQTNWYIVHQNNSGQAAYAKLNWVSSFETDLDDT